MELRCYNAGNYAIRAFRNGFELAQTADRRLHVRRHGDSLRGRPVPLLEAWQGDRSSSFMSAAGGGKSHLMRVASISWCADIPGLQVYLFRRLSDDLVKNHFEGISGYPALLKEWIDAGHCKINFSNKTVEFWNGSKIFLGHCQYEKDKYKMQGAEV